MTTAGPGIPGTVPPMASSEHSTGALVSPHAELSALATLLDRWRDGTLTDVDAAALVERTNAKLARACWCDQGVCCYAPAHPITVHVAPHRHCILR